jgi:hypothetical protein
VPEQPFCWTGLWVRDIAELETRALASLARDYCVVPPSLMQSNNMGGADGGFMPLSVLFQYSQFFVQGFHVSIRYGHSPSTARHSGALPAAYGDSAA